MTIQRPILRRSSIANIVVLFSFYLAAPLLRAQCKISDFPGVEGVSASPSRPVESSSPDPIQTGVAEFETGFAYSWMGSDSSQSLFSNLVKFGAWCNVEVRWSANSFVSNATPVFTQSGFGDNFLAAQYRFHRESKKLPSMAVGYTIKFDSANPATGLGSGYTDQLVMVMFAKNVGKFSIVSNINFFQIGVGSGNFRHKNEYTLEVSHPIKGRWGVLGEVYYDTHLNQANVAYANSTWGVTYTLRPRLVMDSGSYISFSRGPGIPGKAAFIGASYAFANLYPKSVIPHPAAE
jgi:hypothetical protein